MADAGIEAPTMGLRQRKKEQTRQLIAETARRLFGERGFERVTVAESPSQGHERHSRQRVRPTHRGTL